MDYKTICPAEDALRREQAARIITSMSPDDLCCLQAIVGSRIRTELSVGELIEFFRIREPDKQSAWLKAHCQNYERIIMDCIELVKPQGEPIGGEEGELDCSKGI